MSWGSFLCPESYHVIYGYYKTARCITDQTETHRGEVLTAEPCPSSLKAAGYTNDITKQKRDDNMSWVHACSDIISRCPSLPPGLVIPNTLTAGIPNRRDNRDQN